jgi:uncharacterized SAM-binding protein YcdF (DUF218 family)
VKWTVLILAVMFLVVEGYFVYNWYGRYYGDPAVVSDTRLSAPRGTTPETTEATVEEREDKTAFIHRAASGNIVDNSTYVDHPWANKNPNAILLVTQVRERGIDAADARPIGVWYDANRRGKWAIFNQDLAPMREGETFNVVVAKGSDKAVFIHHATSENTVENHTYVNRSLPNKNPDAVVLVTPNWNPGGGAGTYNDHFVSVRYDVGKQKWAIFNKDLASIPEGAAFGMAVSDGAETIR